MPIVSPLDNDFYTFTMGQIIWERFPDWKVRYGFKNRTLSIRLSDFINKRALIEDLDNLRYLRYTDKEIQFLRDQGIFSEGYLAFLRDILYLPRVEVHQKDGYELSIEYEADWASAIFMESPLLATVEEHYVRGLLNKNGITYGSLAKEGVHRLNDKIDLWKQYPGVHIIEMATRRRFPGLHDSHEWHERVLSHLLAEIPGQIAGTSNPLMANLYGIPALGTMAHQMPMVVAAKTLASATGINPLVEAQNLVFDLWEDKYGHVDNGRMLIALPDTFGTDLTLSHFGVDRARRWSGFRQDSGDPVAQGDKIYNWYLKNGIDPRTKSLVHSDSLDPKLSVLLHQRHDGHIKHPFGIGGNIGNDVGIATPAIVSKPISVDGLKCVKLSDDPSKSGGNSDTINRYKELSRQ